MIILFYIGIGVQSFLSYYLLTALVVFGKGKISYHYYEVLDYLFLFLFYVS